MKTAKTLFLLPLIFTSLICFSQKELAQQDSIAVKNDTVYSQLDVDVQAEYPGGDIARIKFIQRNLDGSVPSLNRAPKGTYTVVIQCIIDINGKIIYYVPTTSCGYGMEKEVIRVLKKLPKPFSPAMKNGVPVKSKMGFPVSFSI